MRTGQSQFGEKIREAQQRTKRNRVQGIDLYQRALNFYFNQAYDSWFDYYTAKIDLCNTLKDTSKQACNKGRKYLEEIIREANGKNIEEKLNKKKTLRIKYSATHTLAKLQLAFSQIFDLAQHYESYRKAMNQSYKHFKDAFNQILQYLINDIQQGKEFNKWWTQQYLKIKSNYIELLFNQGQKFKDKRYFQIIFDEVDKAKTYLQQLRSQQGQIHLYRCYYYKSMSLRCMQRFEQSYQLLIEDYKFEIANNQMADAQKSRNQLLKICLDLNLIQQAQKYVDRSDRQKEKNQRILLTLIKNRREKIKQHFNQSQQLLRKCGKSTYEQLFEQFDDQQQSSMGLNQYRFDLLLMNKGIKKVIDLYKFQPAVRGLLFYYLAESNYRLQKYEQAQKYIAESLKHPVNNDIEMRDLKIQQLMIKIKNNKSKGLLQKTFNELNQEISNKIRLERDQDKKMVLENQRKHLLKVYKEYQKFQNKAQEATFYSFQTERQKELLNLIKSTKRSKKQGTVKQKISFLSDNEMDVQDSSSPVQKKPKRVARLNPQQQYIQKCQQFGLSQRDVIKQNIVNGNGSTNPLTTIINLSIQQLLVIIPLLKVDNLDLRNHQVNNEVLSSIEAFMTHSAIKLLKLNGVNDLSKKSLLNILKKMSSLTYLSFVNFNAHKNQFAQKRTIQQIQSQPKSIVEILSIIKEIPFSQMNAQNIRVLKLKFCNLLDYHISQINFQRYSSLEEVSLSHNLIEGGQLYHIMNLHKISKVNISDNPICTLSFNHWKGRLLNKSFALERLKLKNTDFNGQLGIELSFILQRVRKIELSQCKNIDNLLQPLWNNFLQGKIKFGVIQQFIMTNVNMGMGPQKLINVLKQCSRLKAIDLRFCNFNNGKLSEEFYQFRQRNIVVKTSEDVILQGMNFDLLRVN